MTVKSPNQSRGQILERYLLVVLAQIQSGNPIVETREHHAMPLALIIRQRQDGGPIQGPDLGPGAALLETGEPGLCRLSTGIPLVRHRRAP